MRIQNIAVIGIGIIVAAASYIASPQAKRPEFDVVSVKPNAAGDHRAAVQMTPGRCNVNGATLRDLIRTAYRVEDFQITGGTAWMSSDRWDVQAKTIATASQIQINEMLQTLLEDRFQLKFHTDSRKLPVYRLVIARKGPKLKRTKPDANGADQHSHAADGGHNQGGGSHGGGSSMTIPQLAQMLEQTLGRTVIDKTGLPGNYDITLSWRPDPGQRPASADHLMPAARGDGAGSTSDPSLPSIFTALQEQLGLKLESGKGPVEIMIIDRAQKPAVQPQR